MTVTAVKHSHYKIEVNPLASPQHPITYFRKCGKCTTHKGMERHLVPCGSIGGHFVRWHTGDSETLDLIGSPCITSLLYHTLHLPLHTLVMHGEPMRSRVSLSPVCQRTKCPPTDPQGTRCPIINSSATNPLKCNSQTTSVQLTSFPKHSSLKRMV